MKKFTSKIASRILIILLVIIVGIINLYIFPKYEIEYYNEKLIPLDLRSSYNHKDVMELFTNMGDDGRMTYRYSIGVIDMIYPLVYGFLLALLLLKIINHIFKNPHYFRLLLFLPLVIIFFDYSENLNTLKMLDAFPVINGDLVRLGSRFSGLKWYLVTFTLILILSGILFLSIKLLVSGIKASKK